MSVLYKIAGGDNGERIADVVFVHGLNGDAFTSWGGNTKDKEKSSFWLNWLAASLPNVGVWSVQYDVAAHEWLGSAMPLEERATNILRSLRPRLTGDRPLIFVVHSMGGLVVREMIYFAMVHGDARDKQFVKRIKGIMFLATPHIGSDVARFVNFVEKLGGSLGGAVAVKDLQSNAPRLLQGSGWFRDNVEELGIQTDVLYEKRPVKKTITIVDAGTADPGIRGLRPTPVDHDHLSISKPNSTDDDVYILTRDFIETVLVGLPVDPQ